MDKVTMAISTPVYQYPLNVVWNTCFRLVKIDSWDDGYSECGLSLTDACEAPQGMSDDSWLAWKQSVRGISHNCAILVGQLEGCCALRNSTPASKPASGSGEPTLNLIPYSDFETALTSCVSVDSTLTLPMIGSTTPMVLNHPFKRRALCDRMMFSQTLVRPYLKPLRSCLAKALYAPPNFSAPGAYYELEAYFYEMCVAPAANPTFYLDLDQNTAEQYALLFASNFLTMPALPPI
jgi:hypothetical protein